MEKLRLATNESPKVVLIVHGDLQVKGLDENVVIVKTDDPENTVLEEQEGEIRINCPTDCGVRVPRKAKVEIEEAGGDAVAKALDGEIVFHTVRGELVLRSVGAVMAEHVGGNIEAKNILGDLQIEEVNGNAEIRDVNGSVNAREVNGNLYLDDVDGDVLVNADGNATLQLDPTHGQDYTVTADGNIVCSITEDAGVNIVVGRAAKITVNLPGVAQKTTQAPFMLTLGDGDANLSLSADGGVVLSSLKSDWGKVPEFDWDFEGEFNGIADAISEQVTQQVEAQMELLEQQMDAAMANLSVSLGNVNLSQEQLERIQQRAREASVRAAARAQEKMRQAKERLERKMAAAQHRAVHRAHVAEARAQRKERHAWGVPWPPPPPEPEAPPISDEERIMILRMLEQKKISLEEAEKLLSALEGRES